MCVIELNGGQWSRTSPARLSLAWRGLTLN